MQTSFGQFLELQLQRLNISQPVAAALLDISSRKLWGWINGSGPAPSYCEERGARVILLELSDLSGSDLNPVERSSKPERSAIEERSEVPPERPTGEVPPEEPKTASRGAAFPPAPRPPRQPEK
jgi:hypothetical protein